MARAMARVAGAAGAAGAARRHAMLQRSQSARAAVSGLDDPVGLERCLRGICDWLVVFLEHRETIGTW